MNIDLYYKLSEQVQQIIEHNMGERCYKDEIESAIATLLDKFTALVALECIKIKKYNFKETCAVAEQFGKAANKIIVKKYREAMIREL